MPSASEPPPLSSASSTASSSNPSPTATADVSSSSGRKFASSKSSFPYVGANARHEDIWRRQSTAFSDLTLIQHGSTGVSLGTNDHPRLVGRIIAQPNLLDILGVQPTLGRNFLPEESVKGHEHVAIISWHLWQTLFNGGTDAIGKSILIAGAPFQVVGILPQNFYFPKSNELSASPVASQLPDNEILTPLAIDPTKSYGWNSDYGNCIALGRLKPGISIAQATENLNAVDDYIAHQIPPDQFAAPSRERSPPTCNP